MKLRNLLYHIKNNWRCWVDRCPDRQRFPGFKIMVTAKNPFRRLWAFFEVCPNCKKVERRFKEVPSWDFKIADHEFAHSSSMERMPARNYGPY